MASAETKAKRLALLRQAIATKRFENQYQLVYFLKENGYVHTQATLSRDLRELRVLRMTDDSGPRYVFSKEYERAKPRDLFRDDIISIEHNGAVIMIRTLPARALGVAEFLNACGNEDIFGAIGQSSVVVVYPKSDDRINAIITFLRN